MLEIKYKKESCWIIVLAILYVSISAISLLYYPSIHRDEGWFNAYAHELLFQGDGSSPKVFNYSWYKLTPFRFFIFRGLLVTANIIGGSSFISGRIMSLIMGIMVLILLYSTLRVVGIERNLSFIVVFSVGFTERFVWSSHVIRPEIYVCAFLSLALFLMVRKPKNSRTFMLNDFFIGLVCGLSVWVYDTGLIVSFAFGLTYFIKSFIKLPNRWNRAELLRFLSYIAGAALFLSMWYFFNKVSNPNFLTDTFKTLDKFKHFYLTGVPASLHFLAKFGRFFFIPRSFMGYFLGPEWRPHLFELIILIPSLFLIFKRIKNHEISVSEKDCLLLIGSLLIGFIVSGYMTIYYWILFFPPVIVIIAISAEKILKQIRPSLLFLGCFSWVFVMVFAQLLLAPQKYHNAEYSSAYQKLKGIMESQNGNSAIMGDIKFSFAFPNRPFTFNRDFWIMKKETGITLNDYCQRYNIKYVLLKTKKILSGKPRIHLNNFVFLGSIGLSSYTGTILRPGKEIKHNFNLLKFQP